MTIELATRQPQLAVQRLLGQCTHKPVRCHDLAPAAKVQLPPVPDGADAIELFADQKTLRRATHWPIRGQLHARGRSLGTRKEWTGGQPLQALAARNCTKVRAQSL